MSAADRRLELHLTDLGNAERFAEEWAGKAFYCHEIKTWLVYDGCRFVPDTSGMVTMMAMQTARRLYDGAALADDADDRALLAVHAVYSQSASRLAAMRDLSRAMLPVRLEDLDRDPWLLNVANGTLDLRTGRLRPHDPQGFFTKLAPVDYDPAATCPRFLDFLNRILSGDADLIAFLQKAIGYSLTGSTREQVLFMAWGPGANGKSTLVEVLARMLGDYAARAPFESFLTRRSEGPRNDLAALVGARLVSASEAGEDRRLDESLIKELTGGDRITVRRLYSEAFTYAPTFKLLLATNARPEIRSTGEAIWRRLRLIPFSVVIPEAERDQELVEKLTAELAGIMAWAVAGCLTWQRDGLGQPPAVRDATADYRAENDPVGQFIAEACETGPTLASGATVLYGAFLRWAQASQEPTMTQTAFGTRLGEKGYHRLKGRDCRGWGGLAPTRDARISSVTGVTRCDTNSGTFSNSKRLSEESRGTCHNGSHPSHAAPNPLRDSPPGCQSLAPAAGKPGSTSCRIRSGPRLGPEPDVCDTSNQSGPG